jgi:hypothetical protein
MRQPLQALAAKRGVSTQWRALRSRGSLTSFNAKHPEYKIISSGGYNNRLIRGGSAASMHAYGAAIDLEQFPIRMHHILRRRNNFDIHWM